MSIEEQLKTKVNGSFVDRDKLHITFLFLGDTFIPENNIISSIDAAYGGEKEIDVSGLGVFPSLKRPRVLFARVVTDLYSRYAALCGLLGLQQETSFSPHITLCRLKGKQENVNNIIEDYKDIKISFTSNKLSLFDSDFKNYYRIY